MSRLFRYFQLQEKGKWEALPEDTATQEALVRQGAKRASILTVSAIVDDSTDVTKLAYRGPFYADIDSGDLSQAIKSAKEFREKLKSLGVPEKAYQIHASGSKGFHFYIHPSAIGLSRAVRRLPYIYREMAVELYVSGLDFQPYCGGRGNLFRLPNVRRDDGKFNVPLFPSELDVLDEAGYRALTSAPRTVVGYQMSKVDTPIPALVQMYERAKAREEALSKEQQKTPVADTQLLPFAVAPPQCVRDLSEAKIRAGTSFNQAGFQLAIYLARSGTARPLSNSLIDRLADTGTSTSYASVNERKTHLQGLLAYTSKQPSKQFSCAAMRGILSTKPCEGCELFDINQAIREEYEVVERPDGYYALSAKGAERRLTNFVLVPQKVVIAQMDRDNKVWVKRVYTKVKIERNHEYLGETLIRDEAWNGRGGFLDAFTGLGDNLTLKVGDQDVMGIKQYVLRDVKDVDHQEAVESAGICRQILNGKPRYTYVEDGMSVNKFQVTNTHLLAPKWDVQKLAMPAMRYIQRSKSADSRHISAIHDLLQVNEKEVVAPLFGWIMSAHLKAHIFGIRAEFPLLGMWGGRGSGKTQTAGLFCALHGCDYHKDSPPSLVTQTEFAFLTQAASCNTIPRIFDEFNKSGMGQHKYARFSDHLKNLFNNSPSGKGSIRGKQLGIDFHIPSSPAIVLSEHQIEVPALRDRLYAIMTREPNLRPRRDYFESAKLKKPFLFQVAKETMMYALEVRDEWVRDQLELWFPQIPDKFTERQKLCRATILLGLDFAERVLVGQMGMPIEPEISSLRTSFLQQCQTENVSQGGVGTTEMDNLMVAVGEMLSMSKQGALPFSVTSANVQARGDVLLLDPITILTYLKMFQKLTGGRMPINNMGEFKALLSAEPYYLSEEIVSNFVQSRPVLKLSLQAMSDKGIDITSLKY